MALERNKSGIDLSLSLLLSLGEVAPVPTRLKAAVGRPKPDMHNIGGGVIWYLSD